MHTVYIFLRYLKGCMLGVFSFSSDSALQGLGCSFQDSLSMPDPTGQVFLTGFEREQRDSFMKQGNKESINTYLMPITLPRLFVLVKSVLYVTKNVHFH